MDAGSIAWLLTASALVLLMTPGLAFFLWRFGKSKKRSKFNDAMYHDYETC